MKDYRLTIKVRNNRILNRASRPHVPSFRGNSGIDIG
jgi:hypothetical protein